MRSSSTIRSAPGRSSSARADSSANSSRIAPGNDAGPSDGLHSQRVRTDRRARARSMWAYAAHRSTWPSRWSDDEPWSGDEPWPSAERRPFAGLPCGRPACAQSCELRACARPSCERLSSALRWLAASRPSSSEQPSPSDAPQSCDAARPSFAWRPFSTSGSIRSPQSRGAPYVAANANVANSP